MHLITTSTLSTLFGLLLIGCTSPNAHAFFLAPQTSFLGIHALVVDLTFAVLIAFLIICHTHHRWVAQNQSFPYSYHPAWSFGPRSLDFQLFVFEVFHVEWLSRTIHMVNIMAEQFLWLAIILGTFGRCGLALAVLVMIGQALSYGDMLVACVLSSLHLGFVGVCWTITQHWTIADTANSTAIAKVVLFWIVTIRTLSHVLEPLPPSYHNEKQAFDSSFGIQGWRVCLTNLPLAIWLFLLGNVSELGAGMPGRLFNPVVYKVLSRCGYRSKRLLSVVEAKQQAWAVVECGWMAHEVTAEMFAWANGVHAVGGLEEGVVDPEKVLVLM